MHSLRELYKTGKGPSSSHTMGPNKAAQIFAGRHGGGSAPFAGTLYGSPPATRKGPMDEHDIWMDAVATEKQIYSKR